MTTKIYRLANKVGCLRPIFNCVLLRNSVRQHRIKNKNRKIQFYNFWNESFDSMYWNRFVNSNENLKKITHDNTIGFFSVFGDRKLINKVKCDINIFYSAENVRTRNNQYPDYFLSESKIDLSMGFECFEDERYIRFPNWLELFFLNSANVVEICKLLRYPNIENKSRFASCISSHDNINGAVGLRSNIIDKLSAIDIVSCAGKFRHNDDTLVTKFSDNKMEYLKDFYFNICPENSNAYGYVTEKIFQSIQSGCIPVYWGSFNNPEPEILNRDAIIFWNKNGNNDDSIKRIKELTQSPKLMNEFLSQPRLLPTAEEKIIDTLNSVEKKIVEIYKNKGC